MSGDDHIFRVAANDAPWTDKKRVRVIRNNCDSLIQALNANTKIRRLHVDIIDSLAADNPFSKLEAFGQVAQVIDSLKELTISFEDPSKYDYVVMRQLLQCTKQIKELYLYCYDGFFCSDLPPHLAGGITGHRTLEKIHFWDFYPIPSEVLVAHFVPMFSSIANLKIVHLNPYYEGRDIDDDIEMVSACFLAQILGLPSLEELTVSYFGFGDEQYGVIQEALSSRESALQRIAFRVCDMTSGCLGSLLRGIVGHSNLRDLELDYIGISDHDGDNVAHLLAPLSHNTGLHRLHVSFCGLREGERWPRFDFVQENSSLKHLVVRDQNARLTGEILSSLYRALRTNRSLAVLHLEGCCGKDDGVDTLEGVIRNNAGLKVIHLNGGTLTGAKLVELVPALVPNTTLEFLDVSPNRHDMIDSADTAVFVRGALLKSQLKYLGVGRCSREHIESLVPVMAQNHHLEKLQFRPFQSEGNRFEQTIDVICILNKFGRRYLIERGQECKVAGVKLLSAVSEDLDCLFYHLRENPMLCDRRETAETVGQAGVSPKVRYQHRRPVSRQQQDAKKRRRTESE